MTKLMSATEFVQFSSLSKAMKHNNHLYSGTLLYICVYWRLLEILQGGQCPRMYSAGGTRIWPNEVAVTRSCKPASHLLSYVGAPRLFLRRSGSCHSVVSRATVAARSARTSSKERDSKITSGSGSSGSDCGKALKCLWIPGCDMLVSGGTQNQAGWAPFIHRRPSEPPILQKIWFGA